MTRFYVLTFIMLTSCSTLPSLDYIDLASSSAKYLTGRNDYNISQEDYDREEFSFLKLRIGRSSPVIMVLAYVNDGVYQWVGADNTKLYTYKAKVIELNGFSNDFKIQNPKSKIKNFSQTSEVNYSVDFYQPQLLSLNVNGTITKKSKISSYNRLNKEDLFQGYEEAIYAPLINWKERNYYFYDTDGMIFKTTQNIHPRIPTLDIEFYIK